MLSIALAWRLARRLHDARTADDPAGEADGRWERLARSWAELERGRERWLKARGKLPAVAEILRAAFAARTRSLVREFEGAGPAFAPAAPAGAGIGDLFADLRQLEAEFEAVEVRWKEKVVAATTEAIALRGVELGPFAVELHWDAGGEPAARFEIVALEPNPAAGNRGITHPHVRDRHLCVGEAAGPLRRALEDGRIADAFVLVRSVLRTYNPASPYTPLSEWGGAPCGRCGRSITADDRFPCEGCDADYCESCSRDCGRCDSTRCPGCLDACALCDTDCCSNCLDSDPSGRALCPECWVCCPGCHRRFPKDRLVRRLCPHCSTPFPEDPDDDDDPADDELDGEEDDEPAADDADGDELDGEEDDEPAADDADGESEPAPEPDGDAAAGVGDPRPAVRADSDGGTPGDAPADEAVMAGAGPPA